MVSAVIAAMVASGCGGSDEVVGIPAPSLLVVNDSDFAIVELYMTEVDNPDYGPNLLYGDVLLPGEELLVTAACDFYDVLLVDEDGVDCELFAIDVCENEPTFVIRNNTCSVFEATGRTRGETQRQRIPAVLASAAP